MAVNSAGILVFRYNEKTLEVLLVHPGGPFYAKKDAGAWSIPKGEFTADEEALVAALREFKEEIGIDLKGTFIPLTSIKQKNGKRVHAWAVEANINTQLINSNSFTIEWPPHSGKMQEFPEIDKAEWLNTAIARQKIIQSQVPLIDELEQKLAVSNAR